MVFHVKAPILGFESITQLELMKIDDIFMRLQSPETLEPSFTLINPFVLRSYAFDIPAVLQEKLGIDDQSNLLVYNIVMIQSPIEKSTVNFAAPLIFNTDTHCMAQHIINDHPEYGVIEPIDSFFTKEA
ncbi:MAG: flagellar assembly protein FliW [Campylobacterales bacterium]|nr:flagellar assembly protein FliW [Campylobacterales bacterium]